MGQGQTKRVSVPSEGALPVFHYHELAEATNNFAQRLGQEEVYYGKLKDGCPISVEKLDQSTFQNFINRRGLYSRLFPHENLVSIYGYTKEEEKFLLVHEYISNGTLESQLRSEVAKSRKSAWLTRLDIAIDVANALACLEDYGIVHRNVKPSNIFLDENFCAKVRLDTMSLSDRHYKNINDFLRFEIEMDYVIEDLYTDLISYQSDVYNFGVVLCELLSSKGSIRRVKRRKFERIIFREVHSQELDELLDPKLGFQSYDGIKQMMTEVASLAMQCLQLSGELRPTIKQVLNTLKNIREKNSRLRISYNELEDFANSFDRTSQGIPQMQIFSYNELEHATDRFDKCLGKGAFGIVFYGKLQDGREVAVKRFLEKKDSTTMLQFAKEVEVLSLMRHQHLVSLYGYSCDLGEELILVYEYISNGTLSIHLRQHSSIQLPWSTRLNIAIQTASALAYLHESGIIHRDVKANNILLDDEFSVKVADFGLSRFLPQFGSKGSFASHVSTAPQGTYGYMDPEYITYNRVSDKSDVYSFGVILFELISSKPPAFMDGPQHVTLANFAMSKILNKALEELLDPGMQFDSDNEIIETIIAASELAFQCVQCPKELRPSMKQVLETLEGIKQRTWEFNQIT